MSSLVSIMMATRPAYSCQAVVGSLRVAVDDDNIDRGTMMYQSAQGQQNKLRHTS